MRSCGFRRIVSALAVAATVAAGCAGFAVAAAPQPAAAAVQGCGYATNTAGNGNFANTTCWFDFSTFNETTARTASGQSMQVTLSGGYVASFTAKVADVPGYSVMHVGAFPTPLETRFAFGTDAYRGVPGKPALYSLVSGGTKSATLTFSNIKVVDALGTPVSGFSFVAADTEDNVLGESFTWSSDKPINELERLAPNGNWGCKAPVGLGTTTVSCAGTGAGGTTIAGGKSTALLVGADSPTTFATQWITPSRSGIAIGIQTSKLTLNKQVAGRIAASDSFDVAVTAPGGVVQAQATTGTADTASTGAVDVLPSGGAYTLSEAMSAGTTTPLSSYQPSWSCTNVATNSATVLPSGTGPTKTLSPAIGDDITCTVTNTAIHPSLSMVKSASPGGAGDYSLGQPVTYSFVVTNTGDVPLNGLTITDSGFSGSGTLSPITCPASADPLDPAEQALCTATYTLTQPDVDAGSVTNTAHATAVSPTGVAVTSTPSNVVIPIDPAPAITLLKTAGPTTAHRNGDVISYSFIATNAGNVTLSAVSITETAFSGSGTPPIVTCPAGAFAPGQSVTCTASYTLTQADVDAGTLTNTATATATAALGANPTSAPSTAAVSIPAASALSLVKSVTPATVSAVGDTVTYTFDVTNTGNVTVTDPSITETGFTGTGTVPSASCPPGALAPAASVQCTAAYQITQADLDAGTITNTATASAVPARGAAPVSNASTASVTAAAAPAVTLVKSSSLTGAAAAGGAVDYSFVVTNTGNVTLSGLVVNDTSFSGTGSLGAIACPATTLAPTASVTCTAPYTLTQADVDSGRLTNTATVSGVTLLGAPVTSTPSNDTRTLAAAPALTLVKSASPSAPADFQAGETITYSFVVTNSGNVTLAGVAVQEGTFSGSGVLPTPSCPAAAASLAPGDQVVCTTDYTVTQADIDAGSVTNSAIAVGTPPGTPTPISSDPSSATVPEPAHPAASVVKTADLTKLTHAGQLVHYSFTVTNTGNTTLTHPTINEGAFTGHGTVTPPVCPSSPPSLLPGQTIVCTASYTVVAADLTGRSLSNTATVTVTPPTGGSVTSDPSTARITDVADPPPAPAAASGADGALASTGSTIAWGIGVLAVVLVAAGGILMLIRRRRRTDGR